MTPSRKRLFVKLIYQRDKTAGGLYTPDSAEVPLRGRVLSTGIDVKDIKAGERVVFRKGTGVTVERGYVVLDHADVLGVESDH